MTPIELAVIRTTPIRVSMPSLCYNVGKQVGERSRPQLG